MKILQLCNKPPYPPVDGGTLAMNSITQGLLAAGCEVRVLSMCSDKHPVLGSRMPEDYIEATHFEAVHVDLGIHLLDAGVSWLCGESYHVKRFISKDFSAKLKAVLQEEQFDIIHVESIFLTPYLPLIRKYSQAPVFLRAHNVEHLIWKRVAKSERNPLKRSYLKHLSLTLRAYECEHVNDYDGVIPITEKDGKTLRELGCRKPIVAIPFGVQLPDIAAVPEEPNSLYHLGSMDWMPNLEGVQWFLEKVWPKVHARLPQLTLYLAGRKMPDALMGLQAEGVRVIGEVPDAMAFMASKQINVVPLLSGSGIRVKIIEALSAGKVVVTTSIGAEGINYTDGKNLLIADTPEQFVEQLQRCVEDPAFCRAVGENASNLILQEYDTALLTQRLLQFYQRLLDKD